MFKAITAALAGLALAMPGQARIESGTKPLIDLIDDSGIAVLIDNEDCADGKFLGLYRHSGMKRAFIRCPGGTVTAADHMVVRHEAVHAIQHCVNVARGTSVFTPVIQDEKQLMIWVRKHLSEEGIEEIKRIYKPSNWLIEFEAFAGMHAYTADQLSDLFRKACLYPGS